MSDERLDGLTDEVLPALIARLRSSGLGELEVATDGWRVRLRRDAAARRGSPLAANTASPGDPIASASNGSGSNLARSPGVGYFSPAPELAIGHTVRAGDALGHVDVLGIAHEVSAPTDGLLSRILAEDGQAVEYGQALAEIDPMTPGPADASAMDTGG